MPILIEEFRDVFADVIGDELLWAWMLEAFYIDDFVVVYKELLSCVFFVEKHNLSSFL